MDLIDEKDVAWLKLAKDGGEIAGLLDGGAVDELDLPTHLVGDDVGQGRLTKARRPIKQDVVEGFAAFFRGLNEDREVLLHLGLPDVFL